MLSKQILLYVSGIRFMSLLFCLPYQRHHLLCSKCIDKGMKCVIFSFRQIVLLFVNFLENLLCGLATLVLLVEFQVT
jgi:hypothetical protein